MQRLPSLAIISCLMRGLEEVREFRHSEREDGVRASEYLQIREDVSKRNSKPWATSTRGSGSGGVSGPTVDTCLPSALLSMRRTGPLKARVPPKWPTAATNPEPPPWVTSWQSLKDPRPSAVGCL